MCGAKCRRKMSNFQSGKRVRKTIIQCIHAKYNKNTINVMPPFAICICSSFYCCCCCRVFFFFLFSSFCLFLLNFFSFLLSFSSLPIATAMDVKDCENQVSGIVITTCWKILKRKLHRTRLSIIIIIWGVCNLSIIAIDEFYRVWSTANRRRMQFAIIALKKFKRMINWYFPFGFGTS